MSELKACPFCGGKAEMDEIEVDLNGSAVRDEFQAYCPNCDVTTRQFSEYNDAVNDWNTRADSEEMAQLKAEKAELLRVLDLALDAACKPYACGEDFVDSTLELLNKLQ